MEKTLTRIREDLKHLHKVSTEQEVKDYLAGMILMINEALRADKLGIQSPAWISDFMKDQEAMARDVS